MSTILAVTLATTCALSTGQFTGGDHIGPQSARDSLLVTPAPYPANRAYNPLAHQHTGRVWAARFPVSSRSPIIESVHGRPGPAHYGAPYVAVYDSVYVRNVHTPVAINTWTRIDHRGLKRFELARNQWLREQGYILSVRTHVNPLYYQQHEERAHNGAIRPRATIHIRPATPEPQIQEKRAMRTDHLGPITRISRPDHTAPTGPAIVQTPQTTEVADAGPEEQSASESL